MIEKLTIVTLLPAQPISNHSFNICLALYGALNVGLGYCVRWMIERITAPKPRAEDFERDLYEHGRER